MAAGEGGFGSCRRGIAASFLPILLAAALAACSVSPLTAGRRLPPPLTPRGETGIASWYGPGFHGKATSSGEIYDQQAMTAAHRVLPLGTHVVVTNLENGRSVGVRINDRGPFVDGRILDLSYAAATALDVVGPGTALVSIDPAGDAAALPPPVLYAVQAGAFADGARADELRAHLGLERRDVYVSRHATTEGVFHRVRVGPYAAREDAAAEARRLARSGLATLIVEEASR
jgi:rare lipoprotein A